MSPWLWPNVLSLDAPCVAIVWQLLLARTVAPIPRVQTVVLGLTVWLIYVVDRILDGLRQAEAGDAPRHRFARRHRLPLLLAAALGLAANLVLAFRYLEPIRLERGALLFLLVAAHFLLAHRAAAPWPKELWTGCIFAAGVWLPALVHRPALLPLAVVFAALCWWNCVAIEAWEHPPEDRARWHVSTHWLARHLGPAAIALAAVAAGLYAVTGQLAGAAELLSAGLCYLLHRSAGRLSRNALRLAVDAALLTPVLFG
ncbi:MAG TPA: hypothetical protein VFQ91_05140 [Bryobacteraceae bacterium]|nr:hypothetical protein [Bryobacteraceae bacterium]